MGLFICAKFLFKSQTRKSRRAELAKFKKKEIAKHKFSVCLTSNDKTNTRQQLHLMPRGLRLPASLTSVVLVEEQDYVNKDWLEESLQATGWAS